MSSNAQAPAILASPLARDALPAALSTPVIVLASIAAAAIAWALLGDAVTPVQAAGGLVILAGIRTARPRVSPRRPRPSP